MFFSGCPLLRQCVSEQGTQPPKMSLCVQSGKGEQAHHLMGVSFAYAKETNFENKIALE
jgi:hypothetical protein